LTTGRPTFLVLSTANEQKADLTKIVLTAPTGLTLGGTTREPVGWTAQRAGSNLTWSAAANAGAQPDHFDQWGFEVEGADQPGAFTFKVALGYADGKTDQVDVPVTVVAGDTAPSTSATTSPPVITPLMYPSQGRANTALAVGAVAAVLSLIALALAMRRRSATGTDQPSGPADDDATGAQDW